MFRSIICLLMLAVICSSCDELSCDGLRPPIAFSSPPNGKAENLQQILGSQLTLTSERDTQHVWVHFDPHTQLNLLAAAETGDTLLLARVVRHHRLFYFIESASDSSYAVHAVRIRKRFVQGLNTNWQQMIYLDNATKRGHYGDLIQSRDLERGSQLLRFDLKSLHPFFRTVLDSLPRYSITHPEVVSPVQQPSRHVTISETSASTGPLSMYPNPATDQVTLSFATTGRWTAQLFSPDGQLVQTQQVQTSSVVLPLTQLPPGNYLVKLTADGKGYITTKHLLVQR
ncbi:T9SS type A sorting domain-containing protein [Hymenobacter sp. BT664]|uniref:T9SS type A sorting domain-containing protein n=1 Tax=Hymenobacter montanus TaxID=2771359 RepID=A0A927BBJ8_9BACT|nr:T9SS type A sorting domain-containing protein [Hymenobacter montanus]MBD2767149.1 T9SS type A sorting domain-containing protein [Hymenobacter montanus]